ncbi:T9SS type B sorting domain-containing protein [Winogradskyella alexanderae]|uniref:T9SS type B sorting domain-containing protein n=1 Tax=Winogradskyella alexanderae TaxID=2877123 RepID=A0ABS7XPK5_9FLAO|nr:T9SS type B sorting domain-containing protein [Winogradskyella alexanderae]MCA0131943.1 T9SS type B sorting domain-containing protein [Winogradskyella alexanderae]
MKRIITQIVLTCCFIHSVSAQGEASNWFFGANAGLNFSSGNPVFNLDGQLNTNEGCGTISDANGQLLFYTDGISIWDKNHNQMPNGFGLLGDPSSTQSGLIVPRPGSETVYYVFTVDSSAGDNGFRYSIVDMSLNNGNGDVTLKNEELLTPSTEKITAVKHANGIDYWLITHGWRNNEFLAYQISPQGINLTPVVSAVGTFHGNDNFNELDQFIANTIGYLKVSPDGNRIASAKFGTESNVEIFDFNDNTGVISNPILLDNLFYNSSSASGAYGVEFSPNGELLYVTDKNFDFFTNEAGSRLFQFDLRLNTANAIIDSMTILYEGGDEFGGLQLALDGKIYVCNSGKTALDVINNPNTLGPDCDYQIGAVDLGGRIVTLGLPPFVQSLFNATFSINNSCVGSETVFELVTEVDNATVTWDFGDGNTSNDMNPAHVYTNPGIYTVNVSASVVGQSLELTDEITIYEIPIANTPMDFYQCESQDDSGLTTFNLETKINEVYGTQDVDTFSVLFYDSEDNALSGLNPLDLNYNISNTQTVYARIQNNFNPSCFDITAFELVILERPDIIEDETLILCEDESLILNADEGFDAYLWSTGNSSASIAINEAGTYTVEVFKNHNTAPQIACSTIKVFSVLPSGLATITDLEIEEWQHLNSITVFAEGSGDYEYSLDDLVYQDSNTFSNVTYGEFTVYVRDKNGCGVISKLVTVLGYPKYFTPNSDNFNPYWTIKLSPDENDFEILIFDRYGKQLAALNAASPFWDGTYNGKLMPTSDYWFILKRPSKNETYTGHFTLKR